MNIELNIGLIYEIIYLKHIFASKLIGLYFN